MTEQTAPTATREALLIEAVTVLRPYFTEVGIELPAKIRISVGFGYSKTCSKDILGQCWKRSAVKDDINTIFVSPLVATFAEALGVLVHELIHAGLDNEDGHKGRFAAAAVRLGLEGPMLATFPGLDLTMRLMTIAGDIERRLGAYDHAPLTVPVTTRRRTPVTPDGGVVPGKMHSGESSERNRWISFVCPTHAGPVRMSRTKAQRGAPFCGEVDEAGLPCMTRMIEK
jgi:hypothetical protein